MKKHFNIRVTGKVQGVWYRASTEEAAQKIGVTGFVQNKPDGSVYLEAEGNDTQLQQLLEWCKQGPQNAQVAEVTHEEGTMQNFNSFSIR